MSSWSQRRKRLYLSVVAVIVLVPLVVLGYNAFHKRPSCFDGLQNGTEQGVDCGGACQKLCAAAFLAPKPVWTRIEHVASDLYNIATYIENPNPRVGAQNVPFHVAVYDSLGKQLIDARGTVNIPPHRNTLAFLPSIKIAKGIPASETSAAFEFKGVPEWTVGADPLLSLSIGDKQFATDQVGSSLQVTLKNTSVDPLPHMSVYAILYDAGGDAIGFSKTVVDPIDGNGSAVAPFTWPEDFGNRVISQEILPVAE